MLKLNLILLFICAQIFIINCYSINRMQVSYKNYTERYFLCNFNWLFLFSKEKSLVRFRCWTTRRISCQTFAYRQFISWWKFTTWNIWTIRWTSKWCTKTWST